MNAPAVARPWEIRRLPGAAARARGSFYSSPHSRRMDTVEAVTQREALVRFAEAQASKDWEIVGLDWRNERSLTSAWRLDDSQDVQGREWRIKLRRGTQVTQYVAWRALR